MDDKFHTTYPSGSQDPYIHQYIIGRGGCGFVDRVVPRGDSSKVYARKVVSLPGSARTEAHIERIQHEARIIRRLRHKHIIGIISTYYLDGRFSIIMDPVADQNLGELLQSLDEMPDSDKRREYLMQMEKWPGCIIRATDYMHGMLVRHKDIKPSNILVRGDHVYITDFDISKEFTVELGSSSHGTVGAHTPNYSAPEVTTKGARRGRASDIFSLGCTFLEMATTIIGPPQSLEHFHEMRRMENDYGIRHPYAGNADVVLRWISYLSSHMRRISQQGKEPHGAALVPLSFLMLDPDQKTRITAPQLLALITSPGSNQMCCDDCQSSSQLAEEPIHSTWKSESEIRWPSNPNDTLKTPVASNWEGAKRLWLSYHMWW